MTDLKTLKDLNSDAYFEEGCGWRLSMLHRGDIRQEAIKDIKKLYKIKNSTLDQKSSTYMSCCTNYPLCSMGQGFLVCGEDKEQIEPIIRYIMWKFNITKEEVKA